MLFQLLKTGYNNFYMSNYITIYLKINTDLTSIN